MKNFKKYLRDFWASPFRWPVLTAIIVVFLLGRIMGGGAAPAPDRGHGAHEAGVKQASAFTCSMHPQIRRPKQGKCPICFMDLIPVETDGEEVGPRQLKLTPHAMKLADIRTAPVERRSVSSPLRLVGKVEVDETRVKVISARVPGRIDRLYVNYTGLNVRSGASLVSLYSPQLITAQQELLQAVQMAAKYPSAADNAGAAREKLQLWGLTPKQIKGIESRGKPNNHLSIFSPMMGIVIKKHAVEGTYIQTGTPIYTIADLSRVWVKLDAYETDINRLARGQTVTFETEAYPGRRFTGTVEFIDPVLNPQTRTVKVRVNVPNGELKLKPDMFVHAVVETPAPGTSSEKQEEESLAPLVIPASAPLVTGARAVVYVAVKDKEGVFEGREIVLGPRAGDFYTVKEGVELGEMVVVNGAFKLDSDLQIQAKPSMMSPEGGGASPHAHHGHGTHTAQASHPAPAGEETGVHDEHGHHHGEAEKAAPAEPGADISKAFRTSIDPVVTAYIDVQRTLADDDFEGAKKAAKLLMEKQKQPDMKLLKGDIHMEWMKRQGALQKSLTKFIDAEDINTARLYFSTVSDTMIAVTRTFATPSDSIYHFHCPMALDDQGAYWLQDNDDTRNPYFGDEMLKCKDLVEPLFAVKK